MEITHNITYEGLELEIVGSYEAPEDGYKGGWSTELIKVNDVDIYWMLSQHTIERINELVIEENY